MDPGEPSKGVSADFGKASPSGRPALVPEQTSNPRPIFHAPLVLQQHDQQLEAGIVPQSLFKRARGRPRSIIFNFFTREPSPDGCALVNTCVFCGFKSRDRSQNPTYLMRHVINSCRAPQDIIAMLRSARDAGSHTRTNEAKNREQISTSHEPDYPAGSDFRNSSPVLAPGEGLEITNRVERDLGGPFPFDRSPAFMTPAVTGGVGRADRAVGHSDSPAEVQLQPEHAETFYHTYHEPFSSSISVAPERELPGMVQNILHENLSDQQSKGRKRTSSQMDNKNIALDGLVSAVEQPISSALQVPRASHPVPFGSGGKLPSDRIRHPTPAPEHREGSECRTQSYPNDESILEPQDPTPSSVNRERNVRRNLAVASNHSVDEGTRSEQKRVIERFRYTEMVHEALSAASGSTLICLGSNSEKSHFVFHPGTKALAERNEVLNDEGSRAVLAAQVMQSGGYNGTCSALALNRDGRLFFLGVDDCFLSDQLKGFLSLCTGSHLASGSFTSIIFACNPGDPAIQAFREIESEFQVAAVVDVAHVSDEICRQMAQVSASVKKDVTCTLMIARFLTTHDLLPDSEDVRAIGVLPDAERFSAVAAAMSQLATQKESIVHLLLSFQDGSFLANLRQASVASSGSRKFARTVSSLLGSDAFVQSLHNSAKVLQPLARLVSLYDTRANGAVAHREIHHVASDCERAARELSESQEPSAEAAIAALLGEKMSPIGPEVVAGNVATLASFLDPSHVPPEATALPGWKERRMHTAIHLVCSRDGRPKTALVYSQLQRFIFAREGLCSKEALLPDSILNVSPTQWWSRFGRIAAPELCDVALQVLSTPTTIGVVAHKIAEVNGGLGSALSRQSFVRDRVFCVWNERLSRMSESELLTSISTPDVSFADILAETAQRQ